MTLSPGSLSSSLLPCPCPFPSPPTLLNTELHWSMDLPWIFPRSSLPPMDTHLWILSSSPFLVSPSSPYPCFLVTILSLILLLSLIPSITTDFLFTLTHCHFVIDLLSYSLNSTMTHSSWLLAPFPLVYKPLALPTYSLSYSYSGVRLHLVLRHPNILGSPRTPLIPLKPQDHSFSPV